MYYLLSKARTIDTTAVGSRFLTIFERATFFSTICESSLSYKRVPSKSDSLLSDYSELESLRVTFFAGFFFYNWLLIFACPILISSFATTIEKKSLVTAFSSIIARFSE